MDLPLVMRLGQGDDEVRAILAEPVEGDMQRRVIGLIESGLGPQGLSDFIGNKIAIVLMRLDQPQRTRLVHALGGNIRFVDLFLCIKAQAAFEAGQNDDAKDYIRQVTSTTPEIDALRLRINKVEHRGFGA